MRAISLDCARPEKLALSRFPRWQAPVVFEPECSAAMPLVACSGEQNSCACFGARERTSLLPERSEPHGLELHYVGHPEVFADWTPARVLHYPDMGRGR